MFASGSFGWLVMHELRIAWRARKTKSITRWIGIALMILYVCAGFTVAAMLIGTPIRADPSIEAIISIAAVIILSLMTTQAIIGSQQTLYETRDLDLLLTAPVGARNVLSAKLVGIAAAVALTYALLLLPVVIPMALLGHPRLFGIVALLGALALAAAAIGLAITLTLARISGPRAARTVGQIAAALMGGTAFLVSQIGGQRGGGQGRGSFYVDAFHWVRARGLGADGWSGLPGRAAFGDPVANLILTGGSVLLFLAVGAVMQHAFLSGYQQGAMRLSRSRSGPRGTARLFHSGLLRSIFDKEFRLLARDPALIFQIVLRIVYLAPIALVAFRHDGPVPVLASVGFVSVVIAGQLAGSFAWLTVSAEDAPDLIAVAPVARSEVDRAKLIAALVMAAPFAVILPVAIARLNPLGALLTLVMTAAGGAGAALVELKLGKPGQRAAFAKRRQGSLVAGLLSFAVSGICGAVAAGGLWLLG